MAQQNNRYQNNTLENVCSFSHTGNHLLSFQLIRDVPNLTDQQKVSAKPGYFCFVTLAPGVGEQANRTYDFKQAINVKYSLQEICGLAFVLKSVANGMNKAVLPYTKFARSNNGQKMVSVWEGQARQDQQNQPRARNINFSIKENTNQANSVPLTPDQAVAIAESLTILFKKGLNLDFERQINNPRTNNNGNNPSYSDINNNQPPQPQQQPQFNNGFQQNGFEQMSPFDQGNDFGGIANEFGNLFDN